MSNWHVKDKRINAHERAVFDAYREQDGYHHFAATVEIDSAAHGGMRVLLGALTPAGKERVWGAVRVYEGWAQSPCA